MLTFNDNINEHYMTTKLEIPTVQDYKEKFNYLIICNTVKYANTSEH